MYSLNWPINIGTCNKNLVRVILILDLNAIFSGYYKYYHCCFIEWIESARIINKIGLRENLQAESDIYELLNNNIVQCTVYAYYNPYMLYFYASQYRSPL